MIGKMVKDEDVIALLSPKLAELLKYRFDSLTPPQLQAIPAILEGENVVVVAPTGTGKTEAAILPILSKMLGEKAGGIKLIYITPLRALNRDILDRLTWWFSRLDFRVAVRHGDTHASERRSQALSPPDVLITTPETFQLLFLGSRLRAALAGVKWVVVDEIHELADDRRGVQLSILLEKLRRYIGKAQFIGLSATLGNPEAVAKLIVGVNRSAKVIYVPVARRFEISIEWPDVSIEDEKLSSKLYVAPEVVAKIRRIKELVEKSSGVLVFTNTRPMTEVLGSRIKLWDEKAPIYVHHGSLSFTERRKVEEMFKQGRIKGVICTSSLELGIDIGHIDLVIQYGSPREVRRLIQRVGRSGHRIGETSRGIILVSNSDDALEAMVLKSLLKQEKIEEASIPHKPYDVMLHELVGLAMKENVTLNEALEIFRATLPYSDLEMEELAAVAGFAEQIDILRLTPDGRLRPGRRAFKYFYGTLSMIPETVQYTVIEQDTGEPVGILDDFFVLEYCEPGARFIMAGRPWEVVAVGEDSVRVRRIETYEGAIPSWVGEEIPVSYEVAQEVGRIRGRVEALAKKGCTLKEIVRRLSEELEEREEIIGKAVKTAYEMSLRGQPVPTDSRIVVEEIGELVIIHAHFGNKVNRVLGKYVTYELGRITGLPIYVSEKQYRITIRGASGEDVYNVLRDLAPEKLKEKVVEAVKESRLFKWRLFQIARRMGVIEPEISIERGLLDKLVVSLKDTPAYSEALREVLYRDMDLAKAEEIARKISSGKTEVTLILGPSPISEEHLHYFREYLEPMPPDRQRALRYMLFKAKLLSTFITLACLDCKDYVESLPVSDVPKKPRCPLCGSTRLAASRLDENEVARRLRSNVKTRELLASGAVVKKYGRAAVKLIAAGLRPYQARKILEEAGGSEEKSLREAWRLVSARRAGASALA